MKAIKTLLAVSVLAAAGAAHSTTVATFSGTAGASVMVPIDLNTDYGTVPHVPDIQPMEIVTSSSGTASAVLDDSGTFTINSNVSVSTSVGTVNNIGLLESFTGTWDGTTFTATGGTQTVTSCSDFGQILGCPTIFGFNLAPPIVPSGSITLAGGTFSAALPPDPSSGAVVTFNFAFGPVVSAVPIPAGGWLLGTGLIGLAGATRRKIK